MTKVIGCIDGSTSTDAVIEASTWASTQLNAPLMLLHVLDHSKYPIKADYSGNMTLGGREALLAEMADLDAKRNRLALQEGKMMLDAAAQQVMALNGPEPLLRQRHGDLLESLEALQDDTRLLVIGKSGADHPAGGAQIGDNVERVIRAMHRPILIVPGAFVAPTQVMLAYDGSDTARKGVNTLAASPLMAEVPCHLVSVSNSNLVLEDMNVAAETLRASGREVNVVQLDGDVEPALHQYQQDNGIDLVVMGAYGHSRIREFFIGSTTTKMIREARVPHLLLR